MKLQDVSLSYGKNSVLEDVSLIFKQGKIYGLVGENGAGKPRCFRCYQELYNQNQA
jgi:ABC-2 type transport system ATP-binding protein